MKIAAFNVENLFDRAKAFNEENTEATKAVKSEAALNLLFEKPVYSDEDKAKMLVLLKELGLLRSDEGRFAILRKIRGKLLKRPKGGGQIEVVAEGRGDWVGWVELKTEPVNETAIMNTGQVLRDVDPDIIAVIEAENRIALKQFSDFVLEKVGGNPFPHVMLIDGNDDRGIDVGLMTKTGFTIGIMKSHIHDMGNNGHPIYSRDCPEYCVTAPSGEIFWILPNHFKSKFGGDNGSAQAKRKAQAARTAEIYNNLIADGHQNIIVLGDLNDTPESDPLIPLLSKTTLKDISKHPTFDTGEFAGKGTFGLGNDNNKIDYLLLSPALFSRVTASGLFRKGAWPGARARWAVYPELKKDIHSASDHHLIWCEII